MASLTFTLTPTQADFDAFAALSGDDNPIHVDPAFAARTRFGATVAHGMYLYSVLTGLAHRLAPGAGVRQTRLMFPAAARVGEELRFSGAIEGAVCALTAERTGDGEQVCLLELALEEGA